MFQVYAENNQLSRQVKPLVNTDVFVEGLPHNPTGWLYFVSVLAAWLTRVDSVFSTPLIRTV